MENEKMASIHPWASKLIFLCWYWDVRLNAKALIPQLLLASLLCCDAMKTKPLIFHIMSIIIHFLMVYSFHKRNKTGFPGKLWALARQPINLEYLCHVAITRWRHDEKGVDRMLLTIMTCRKPVTTEKETVLLGISLHLLVNSESDFVVYKEQTIFLEVAL